MIGIFIPNPMMPFGILMLVWGKIDFQYCTQKWN